MCIAVQPPRPRERRVVHKHKVHAVAHVVEKTHLGPHDVDADACVECLRVVFVAGHHNHGAVATGGQGKGEGAAHVTQATRF